MSTLKIRLPAVIEVALSDSEISDLADRIREDWDEDAQENDVTDDQIKNYLLDTIRDDYESFHQDFAPDYSVDEDKITMSTK